MKNLSGIFLIFLFLLIILTAGCTSQTGSTTTPTTTSVSTPTLTIETTNIPTTAQTPLVTQIPTAEQTSLAISSDDVKSHFMDITFGSDNLLVVKRIPSYISTVGGSETDKETIQNFISDFNDLSNSGKIRENMKEGTSADLSIKFISQEGMKDLSSDIKTYKFGNITTAKIDSSTIYINNNLKGDQRNHTILRSLYYSVGVRGDTLAYPNSIFYYDGNSNTKLSIIDKKALEILFGQAVYNGMIVDDVKKVVYIK